jgi:hypothetical protein
MRFNRVLSCLAAVVVAAFGLRVTAQTVQTAADVFDGRPFLWVEAENFSTRGEDLDDNGWKVVSKENPITSVGNTPLPILPADSNVSGTALLDDVGGGGHSDTAQYQVQFITAGTYQIYLRHSMYDSADADSAYGNEDSFYMSPAFNKNSESDWIGFEGLDFDENDLTAEVPTPGFGADPAGFKPSVGDSGNDGWTAIRDWGVKSEGVVSFPNNADAEDWNGHFNWYNRPFFVGANPAGGFASDFGFKTEYTVSSEVVGQTLTFEIGTREAYGVLDGFLFIQDNDVDLLDMFSQEDLDQGILPQPANGDYNNNGAVDAADFVLWRDGGPLANDATAGVQPGDYDVWRANFGVGSGSGSAAAFSSVPEPASLVLFMLGIIAFRAAQRPGRY